MKSLHHFEVDKRMPLPTKVTDLISALNLIPHPEGGFFIETYRSGSIPMSTQGKDILISNNILIIPGMTYGYL